MAATILVVDDEPDVRLLCRVNLEFEGYRVVEAADGAEALEQVERSRPDLILLDVMMPRVDGWDVLGRLKSEAVTSGIPVVMLTAKAQDADRRLSRERGAVAYMTKPFTPSQVSAIVRDALDSSSGANPAG